jgi:hypothetical protein
LNGNFHGQGKLSVEAARAQMISLLDAPGSLPQALRLRNQPRHAARPDRGGTQTEREIVGHDGFPKLGIIPPHRAEHCGVFALVPLAD